MKQKKQEPFSPADLPNKDAFRKKEIYQHPQPADSGKPLNIDEKKQKAETAGKEQMKTSKEEGINESRSVGNAGAFEGFEDQEKR